MYIKEWIFECVYEQLLSGTLHCTILINGLNILRSAVSIAGSNHKKAQKLGSISSVIELLPKHTAGSISADKLAKNESLVELPRA